MSPVPDLESLAPALATTVPADALEVERNRSIGDRMAGRPGKVVAIRVTGPELILRLEGKKAELIREVRGVVISRRTVPMNEWLELLAGQLRILSAQSLADDTALSQTLSDLGLRERGADLVVSPADPAAGLRALPGRLTGRVPPDVAEHVQRIVELLIDTLGRIEPDGSQAAHVVLRTATDYLPRTLRGYVALPPDWASTYELGDGRTALTALREQLAVLESGVSAMRDAALRSDATDVLVNGRFLTDRFAPGSL